MITSLTPTHPTSLHPAPFHKTQSEVQPGFRKDEGNPKNSNRAPHLYAPVVRIQEDLSQEKSMLRKKDSVQTWNEECVGSPGIWLG